MEQQDGSPDYTELDSYLLASRLGDDGAAWAKAFCQHGKKLGLDIDEGWALGWFCNCIETSFDTRMSRAFGRGPCYFDDRAWGQPPGTAAEKLRGKPVGWVMSPDGWATAECGCKHAVVNSTYKPCPAHSQRSRP
jgi:hypothetical protein